MKFSRAAALSLLFAIGAASPGVDCSHITTTITITVKEPSILTSTVTLGEAGGYGGGSGATVYQTVTAPAQTVTVNNGGTVIEETSGFISSSSSLKSFKTSTPNFTATGSLLGAQVTPSADATGAVTQVNVISGVSKVQVCPTAAASVYDCTEVVYGSGGEVIIVNIITIYVTVDVYGEPSTVTITKIASATSTPGLPPTSSASLLGTKTGKSPCKPTGSVEPYSYGNESQPKNPTGTIRTGTTVSHKPTGTGKPLKQTHVVSVGENGILSFSPAYIDAEEGETVRFKFYPINHTVTSCDVAAPCVMNGVYDSGFKPVLAKNMTTFVDFPVTNATNPVFFFSRQNNECESGMVFAINPKSKMQYDEFILAAKNKKTTITSHEPTGTAYSTSAIRGTGSHPSGSGRPISTHSDLGISVTGSSTAHFPTGGSNTALASGTGTAVHHIETGTGFAHPSSTFKSSGSISSSGFPRPTGIISGSSHASSTGMLVSPTSDVKGTAVSSNFSSTTSSSSSSSHSNTRSSSSTITTTTSINGYVPYIFPTPVASYVAQSYRA
ncbi:hypothetical protein NHQ30_005638 [Ciborinia camelliae]|nr:hypothetical protein NHQ30_005638 [Ciborinia camelliae]